MLCSQRQNGLQVDFFPIEGCLYEIWSIRMAKSVCLCTYATNSSAKNSLLSVRREIRCWREFVEHINNYGDHWKNEIGINGLMDMKLCSRKSLDLCASYGLPVTHTLCTGLLISVLFTLASWAKDQ